ncbi:helix-turn-helix domain-containing protein [Pseudoxanthomonas sp. SL93]|uniref:Crp/Fnr family transcriptional regulator n=1 Tax=Pseudoxanthomonas sp. SL93 TaxID=2995142 RepID=UPI002271B382|nr:helix-turn-helix domain-containing protein [Pseudoxanthomonas sp. SL93]WAC62113.1 helix-turn-helix domain-containing protein [Pseudoxanthomonas sp. SL93]
MSFRILRQNGVPVPAEALADPPACQANARGCTGCLVRHLAVCAALPLENARELEALADDMRLRAGELLVREGEARRGVFTVTRGALRRMRLLPDGRRLVAGFLMPGDFIGFSGASHYRHSIEAIIDSTVCAFSMSDMRTLCSDHPQLERELLERACVELDATRGNLMSLARLNPMERLAGFLVDMAMRRRRQGQDDSEVILPMTRTDIADYLGLTVETVSRSFTRLRQEGSIATDDPHHVRLLDRARLDALAEARA